MSDVLSDTQKVSELRKITADILQRLEKENIDVIKHFADIKNKINTAADMLIAAIQRDRDKLLSKVESIKLERIKQVETVKQELEQHKMELESFEGELKSFEGNFEMLLCSGTAARDVIRNLHEQADELMKFDVIGHVDSSLPPVNFFSSKLLNEEDRNLVGTVTVGQLKQATT